VIYRRGGAVRVISGNDLDVTATYPELATLGDLLPGRDVIVDGEIIALDPSTRPGAAGTAAVAALPAGLCCVC
jgi:bifunctional non-homologous end joining protein LigD